MRRPFRSLTWTATAGMLVVLAGPLVTQSAADAPTAQGWWNAAHQGVPPPAPPDVPPDGLLVQGAAARPAGPGAPGLGGTPAAPASTQAISALTFPVPPDAIVEQLVLKLVGDPPQSTTVTACAVTGPYEPVQNGEFAKRPPFDCAVTAVPMLDPAAKTLVFGSDLANLVREGQLSLVLVPGELDRLIFEKPGEDALTVRSNSGTGAPGEAVFDPGAPPAFSSPSFGGGGGFDSTSPPSGGGFDSASPPTFGSGSLDAGGTSPLGAGGSTPPAVAATPPAALAGPQRGPSTLAGQGAPTGPDNRTLLLLGLLAVVGAFAMSTRQAAAPGAAVVPAPIPPQERGIGRFRQVRASRAVPL